MRADARVLDFGSFRLDLGNRQLLRGARSRSH